MGVLNDMADFIADPLGINDAAAAKERQNRQWQTANHALNTITELVNQDDPDHQAIIAVALTGLLALKLSET